MLIIRKITAGVRFFFRKRLSISPSSIDPTIKDHHFSIGKISAFKYREVVDTKLQSTNTSNPHPLYLTKISWHIIENLNNFLNTPIDSRLLKTLVHMSNHFEYYMPLEFDKKYLVNSHLCLIEPHRKGCKLTIRFDYRLGGELVASEHTTGLLFGVKCRGEGISFGTLPSNVRVKEEDIWSSNIFIEKNLPYIYAEQAEIDAPIHTDPQFAKSIGLPDIILQGTCTFAMSVSLILSEFEIKENDVKQLSVNFTGMLITPNSIKVAVVFKSENKIVFNVYDDKGNALVKGGNIFISDNVSN